MIFSDILRFFCVGKKWRLLTQVSRTSDHDSLVSRMNSFNVQAESCKCRFPRAIVVFCGLALWQPLLSPNKMAAKNHRLSWHCLFNDVCQVWIVFQNLKMLFNPCISCFQHVLAITLAVLTTTAILWLVLAPASTTFWSAERVINAR